MSPITETVRKIVAGETTCEDTARRYISVAEEKQKELNSFITLLGERALARAEEEDRKLKKGVEPGLLAGVPVSIKDNMLLEGTPVTCGSRILKGYISPYTATAAGRLEEAGALIIGKTNMDEFAMGSSGETSAFGPARNPSDPDRIPGGSSSGAAVSVASGQVLGALGSDTGGSIRQPSAMCGVVGMKPTYGLVSRYGLVAFASSLDQIGPLASSVEDAAVMLQVISGYDPADMTSLDIGIPDFTAGLEEGVKGLRFGVPAEYMAQGLNDDIRAAVERTAEELKKAGASVEEVSLPHTEYAVAVYYILAPAEASSNLARYDSVKYGYRASEAEDLWQQYCFTRRDGFGAEVKRRIMLGTYVLSSGYYDAYYLKAQKARGLIKKDFEDVFAEVDCLLTPTAPSTAFRIGEKTEDPLKMYLSDIYTISCNLAGIPGINVPAGTDDAGLPVGVQLMGPYFSEKTLLRAARFVERIYE